MRPSSSCGCSGNRGVTLLIIRWRWTVNNCTEYSNMNVERRLGNDR